MRNIVVLTSIGLSCFGAAAAWAQGKNEVSPFQGRWLADLSQSTESVPTARKAEVWDIVRDDAMNYDDSNTTTYSDGRTVCLVTHAQYDGDYYPVKGFGYPVSMSVRRSGKYQRQFDIQTRFGISAAMACDVSPDGKTMTCDEAVTLPDGSIKQDKSVFVRE
jgi:hypothetical protein